MNDIDDSLLSDLSDDECSNFFVNDNSNENKTNIEATNTNINNGIISNNNNNNNNFNFNFINEQNDSSHLNQPKTIKDIASGDYTNARQAQKIINQDARYIETFALMLHIFSKSKGTNPPEYKYSNEQIITENYGEEMNKIYKKKMIEKKNKN